MNLNEQRAWQAATVVVGILSIVVTLILALSDFRPGEISLRPSLEYSTGFFRDALSSVDDLNPSVSIAGEEFSNLFKSNSSIKNNGDIAILPESIRQPIAVEVQAPWKLVSVVHSYGVRLEWSSISETRFESIPALLNPNDISGFEVFITNTEIADPTSSDVDSINMEFTARIVDVPNLVNAETRMREEFERLESSASRRPVGPIMVVLDTLDIFVFLLLMGIYLGLYIRLLSLNALVASIDSWKSIGWICLVAAFSAAASESTVDLIMGPVFALELFDVMLAAPSSFIESVFGPRQLINLIVLLAHLLTIFGLSLRLWLTTKKMS